jgi:hypothetical protein
MEGKTEKKTALKHQHFKGIQNFSVPINTQTQFTPEDLAVTVFVECSFLKL